MKCTKVGSDVQSLTNRVVVNGQDFPPSQVPHIKISTSPGVSYVMSTLEDNMIPRGSIGFGKNGRQWAVLSIGQDISVSPYKFDLEKNCISILTVSVDFLAKKNTSNDNYDTDRMTADFCAQFAYNGAHDGECKGPSSCRYQDTNDCIWITTCLLNKLIHSFTRKHLSCSKQQRWIVRKKSRDCTGCCSKVNCNW